MDEGVSAIPVLATISIFLVLHTQSWQEYEDITLAATVQVINWMLSHQLSTASVRKLLVLRIGRHFCFSIQANPWASLQLLRLKVGSERNDLPISSNWSAKIHHCPGAMHVFYFLLIDPLCCFLCRLRYLQNLQDAGCCTKQRSPQLCFEGHSDWFVRNTLAI